MLAEIHSGALTGIEAYAVSIEVNAGHGEPKTVVVGLPDAAVKESADRVWTALLHSGFEPPKGRTTINLAPANRRKEGPCFDLPIALGILAATDGLRLEGLLRAAMQELQLSARAYNRILKVARTVADLAEAEWIGSDHVAEAVGYRSLDRPLS
jgi:magnesium chelatase family protein